MALLVRNDAADWGVSLVRIKIQKKDMEVTW